MYSKNMLNYSINRDNAKLKKLIKVLNSTNNIEDMNMSPITLSPKQIVGLTNKLSDVIANLLALKKDVNQKHAIPAHLDTIHRSGNEWQSNIMHYKNYGFFLETNHRLGNTNGYVIIKPNQRGFKLPFNYEASNIRCNGGITFDEYADRINQETNFKSTVRVIGFDTAHVMDYVPKDFIFAKDSKHYNHWTDRQLINQCKEIINQLLTKSIAKEEV